MKRRFLRPANWILVLLASTTVGTVSAQGLTSNATLASLEGVGIDQKLSSLVPTESVFTDESGQTVKFGDYLGKRPILLSLVYYECPMLCTEILNGTVHALRAMTFEPGKEFDLVAVSIDPGESSPLAAAKKAQYLVDYGRPDTEGGWHFLTGSEENVKALADSVGFRYRYIPESDLYSHAAAIMLLTPEGRVSRYFFGVDYAPGDLRLGIVEASQNRVGNLVDEIYLYCFQYDPATGKYSLAIMNVLRACAVATVLILGSFMFFALRKERGLKSA